MKKCAGLVLLLSLLLAPIVHADDLRVHRRLTRLTDAAAEARVLRNTGIATTIFGIAFTIAGTSIFVGGGMLDAPPEVAIIGGTILGLGQVGVTAGVPMWAVGGARQSKYERAALRLAASGIAGQF